MADLFRIENQSSYQGLWYDKNGSFQPLIDRLADGKARDMPMGFDPDFGADGHRWYSACESIPALSCVFSLGDVIELEGLGYSLYRFGVSRFRTNDWHALFTREDVVDQQKVDLGILKRALLEGEAA